MASPAPKSPEQTDKSKKYDRQLRLWGDHGQSALENSSICLVNASGVGTEILKSLVLPGIGAFTILDGMKVREDDLESNFFIESESIGKPRAEIATQLLVELNPDVHGDYLEEDVDHVLRTNPTFFNNFSIVIATELKESILLELAGVLWENEIPFIYTKSYGFLGYVRVQVKEHRVIESHPDNQLPDLRLDRPFPALRQYVDIISLDALTLKDHAHVPFLIILFKALEKWQKLSSQLFPSNLKEKQMLREIIREMRLKNEDGIPEDEENFEEAIRAINSAVCATTVPSHIRAILDDSACVNISSKSQPFWILAKALRDFVAEEGEGALPLRGAIPDMTAETSRYVALQQLYHTQARRDAEMVFRRAQQMLRELNVPSETITEADARLFCRHSHDLYLSRGTSIQDEYQGKSPNLHNLVSEIDPPGSLVLYYLLFRGLDKFLAEFNCFPGELKDDVEPDIMRLKACIGKLLADWGWAPIAKDDYLHEICRYGGSQLHSVSAFIGGCAAQEAIKLVTSQYKPADNTFIYDATTSTTATFIL